MNKKYLMYNEVGQYFKTKPSMCIYNVTNMSLGWIYMKWITRNFDVFQFFR